MYQGTVIIRSQGSPEVACQHTGGSIDLKKNANWANQQEERIGWNQRDGEYK
jgi:hypothetical protein